MGISAAIDNAILAVAPQWGAARAKARLSAMAYRRAYEAAEPTRLRRSARDHGSGNAASIPSGPALRAQARHLDRNHDLARGGLNTLVQNVIGAHGITAEPQPRNAQGDIDQGLVDQIRPLWKDWSKRPEVTWQHDWASTQRILVRSLFRDGESLAQELIGAVPYLDHGTRVPFSLELIESDLLPFDLDDPVRNILAGVECNSWNRVIAYHLYRKHPGDPYTFQTDSDTKRVLSERIRHLKLVDRINQRRGVCLFASALTRLEDIKDYEESERVAAKIAASFAAVIIKGDASLYNSETTDRTMNMQAGMIFDDLRPGEDVRSIDSKRPNPNLETFRGGQLRAGAAGFSISFSSFAKNYNGTYSAQRQELVEQYGAYGVLASEVISQLVRPTYERFISACLLSGELVVPRGSSLDGISDALYQAPSMPWINPMHEVAALEKMEDNTYMAGPQIIRRLGNNPQDVLDQQSAWLENKRLWNIPHRPGSGAAETEAEPATADTTE